MESNPHRPGEDLQLCGILDAKKALEGVKRAAFKKGNA